MSTDVILEVKNLVPAFATEAGRVGDVEDVRFSVAPGRTLGIVGESGCGKSVTALSIMRLLPKPSGIIERGQVVFRGTDILRLPADELHGIRGNRISMIFQEPMTALNPVQKIGKQLREVFWLHYPDLSEQTIREKSIKMLKKVGIPEPEARLNEYMHQISGGMRQRIMIAMALLCKPDILIADEPTTALDVTIQAQILDLIKKMQQDMGMSVIFITHDLGVIAEVCDAVLVMYAGRVAEQALVGELFKNPLHPYTRGLLSSIPKLESPRKSLLKTIPGMVPSLLDLPKGCRFRNRCNHAMEKCKTVPPLTEFSHNHLVACHLYK